MTKQNKIHRVFLIFLFAVCAAAVVFLIKEKTDSASALTTNLSSGVQTSWEEVQPTATTTSQASNPEVQKATTLAQQSVAEKTTTTVNSVPTTPTPATTSWNEVQPTATTTTQQSNTATENAATATKQTSVTIKEETRTGDSTVRTDGSQEVQQNPSVQQQIVSVEPLSVAPAATTVEEKSEIVSAPVIVEAKNISQENNPKVSGKVDNSLKIDTVAMNKKDETKSSVALSGKAQPNAIVTIYIFSTDPVVIKVKTDANGNWNYELDKELANGQHEAFVAVTDDSGKIISKSEPIAFVKTAQAASIIPMSEFTGNESPIEKSSQQFILMAIIIMSICLLIALVLIGFLSHKRNLNEGIN